MVENNKQNKLKCERAGKTTVQRGPVLGSQGSGAAMGTAAAPQILAAAPVSLLFRLCVSGRAIRPCQLRKEQHRHTAIAAAAAAAAGETARATLPHFGACSCLRSLALSRAPQWMVMLTRTPGALLLPALLLLRHSASTASELQPTGRPRPICQREGELLLLSATGRPSMT